MKQQRYIAKLLEKALNGTLTDREFEDLANWYNSFDDTTLHVPESYARSEDEWRVRMLNALYQRIHQEEKPRRMWQKVWSKRNWTIAAAVIGALLLATGVFYHWKNQQIKEVYGAANIDIAPGSNRAILTLADGRQIDLDKAENGLITTDQNVEIRKSKNGELYYDAPATGNRTETVFNTLQTPRGGQFQIILPDGSRVWLNADSKLRYPQQFTSDERKVYLEGEAFFDIKPDKVKKFKVETDNQEVVVLGTAFNINAYHNERYILTTLTRGSVQVISPDGEVFLQPGQQSYFRDGEIGQRQADIATALAWRNGKMAFNDAEITDIMSQVERWYDIDVRYPNGIPKERITGGISRNSNLRDLLKIMEYSKINFKLQEDNGIKTLLVMP